MILETARTLLRSIEAADNQQVFDYRSDAEANKFQGWVPSSLEEVNAFIAKNPKEFNQSGTWFQLVIIEKLNHEIIGDIGVHFIDNGSDNFQCELGCTLNKKRYGKGFATETMRATIDYLFNELDKHRIIASVDPQNTSSIKLIERLGFRKEAHFIESLLIDGKWVDDIVYGLLKSEWKEKNS